MLADHISDNKLINQVFQQLQTQIFLCYICQCQHHYYRSIKIIYIWQHFHFFPLTSCFSAPEQSLNHPSSPLLPNICVTFITITLSVRRLADLALNHLLHISGSHEKEACAHVPARTHTHTHTHTHQKRTKASSVSLYGGGTRLQTVNLPKWQEPVCVWEYCCWGKRHEDLNSGPETREQGDGVFRGSFSGERKNEACWGARPRLLRR